MDPMTKKIVDPPTRNMRIGSMSKKFNPRGEMVVQFENVMRKSPSDLIKQICLERILIFIYSIKLFLDIYKSEFC